MSTKRTLKHELHQYGNAIHLLELGARVPIVYEMTHLSNWYLRKLSLEIRGESPRKGQLPNSEIWYLKKQNNLHASLFTVIYDEVLLTAEESADGCHALVDAYRIYCNQMEAAQLNPLLTIDRAWGLVKSLQNKSLKRCRCRQCQGSFVAAHTRLEPQYVCWECRDSRSMDRLLELPAHRVLL
jgi:flagellar transcriptional activator FlhC